MTDTRQRIVDTAVALVADQGVRGVSFREVARRAGVSHQAPYHHFGSHHGILEAIAREGFSRLTIAMREGARRADPEATDPLEGLYGLGLGYVRFARSHVGHLRVMFQRSHLDGAEERAPLPEAEETFATLVDQVAAVQAAGYGASLDLEAMVELCWSSVHGFATLAVEGLLADKPLPEAPGKDGPAADARLCRTLVEMFRIDRPDGGHADV